MMSQKHIARDSHKLRHVFPTRSTSIKSTGHHDTINEVTMSCSGSHLREYENRQIESALNLLYSITFTNSYQIYSTTNLYR